ncbi:MAG TPA: efflux RND transporter periplasmic adaptor subunit [Candidatus Udaeobacter sp.]|nr:efflux RND transporter periplasmic adaptor subunit [Candidatus Udaeobacter sp.]
MKKWTIGLSIFIILAAAGAGAYYFYFVKDKEAAGVTPSSRTVTATKGSIVKQISGTGSVAANSRETITAGKSGTIATVNVKKGDKIKAGQVLVTFESADDYDDKITTLEKNITKVQQSIDGYQQEYKEAIGTENEEAAKESLEKNMEDANEEIADYEDQLQDIYDEQAKEEKVVSASIDGEVTEMDIEAGDEVNSNTTIATIVDYTKLEFVTTVDELDISSVKVGQAVDLSLSAITDKTIDAVVSEIAIEGTSNNGSSSFEVNILLKDIEGVKVGMSGEAAITIASKENIVLVPVNAVVEMGTRSFVRIPGENGGETGAAASSGQQSGRSGGQSSTAGGQPGAATGQSGAAGQAASEGRRAAAAAGQTGASGEASAAAGGGFAAGGRAGGRMADALGGQLVAVTTGLSDENFVEIVTGLEEGDSVLVPIAQGTQGMGTDSEEMTMQQGGFPGGGMNFPGGMGGGGMVNGGTGGGGMRSTGGTR